MKPVNAAFCLTLICAGTAFAHSGVKNAAVLARMDAMSGIGAQMKVLGKMAKGQTKFDAKAASAATAAIAKYAAATPDLFQARENDPKSEALPAIWTNFEDFAEKSRALETVALKFSAAINQPTDLAQAMPQLGETCKACHKLYRE